MKKTGVGLGSFRGENTALPDLLGTVNFMGIDCIFFVDVPIN